MTKCIKTVLLALTSIVFLVSCDEDELTDRVETIKCMCLPKQVRICHGEVKFL